MRVLCNTSLVFASILTMALAGLLTVTPAQGQTFTVLSDIPNTAGLANPGSQKIVQGRNGELYSASGGAVYRLTLSGTDTLVTDIFRENNGAGVTLGADGNFYSTSALGGTGTCGFYGCGYAWRVSPAGVLTTLYNFQGTPDGCAPNTAPVQAPSGIFYGTTPQNCNGGSNDGIIYSLTSSGTYKVLHTFSGSDGAAAVAPLTIGPDGNTYGGTQAGGSNNLGVLFRMTPSGTYTVLHNFAGTAHSDGQDVESGMTVGNDGNLYGVTYRGGTGSIGVIFKLSTSGAYTIIAQVPQPGTPPTTSLAQGTNGKFYGIFGTGSSGNNGVIYSVTTSGTITRLHSFCQGASCTDGYGPSTPLVQSTDGKFYGLTIQGGTPNQCNSGLGCGVFYSLDVGLAPFINLSTYAGNIGSTVGIFGQGFDSASVVKFNGVAATKITLSGTTYITATVPAGARDGRVTVTTGTITLSSTKNFIVHNTWSKGAAMPTAVEAAAAGFINGRFYVVGGGSGTTVFDNNQVYNTATNAWTTAAAMPSPVTAAASAVVNGILYLFGGYTSTAATNEVQAYNPVTNKWTTKAAMPTARGSAVAVVDGTSVYVIGGNGSTLRLTSVEKYNTTTNTWTEEAPLLVGKSEPSGGLVGSRIVTADGYTTSEDTGDNEAYSVSTNKWSAETADPKPRNASCFGAISGELYVAGGGSNGTPESSNESFNTGTNKWTTLSSMPQAVIFPASAVANGQLYCFGGANVDHGSGTVYSSVQIYQP